jgi:hypothetical protein
VVFDDFFKPKNDKYYELKLYIELWGDAISKFMNANFNDMKIDIKAPNYAYLNEASLKIENIKDLRQELTKEIQNNKFIEKLEAIESTLYPKKN